MTRNRITNLELLSQLRKEKQTLTWLLDQYKSPADRELRQEVWRLIEENDKKIREVINNAQ